MKRFFPPIIFIFTTLLFLVSACSTLHESSWPELSERPLYYGSGSGKSALEALNSAKLEAVRGAVSDLLGKPGYAANREKINDSLFSSVNVNSLVFNDSLIIRDSVRQGDLFYTALGIRINLKSLVIILRSNNIFGNLVHPGESGAVLLPDQVPPRPGSIAAVSGGDRTVLPAGQGSGGGPKPVTLAGPEESKPEESKNEESKIIEEFLQGMTYMVYFDTEKAEDRFIMNAAVSTVNEYLISRKKEVVDFKRIEDLKKERELVYEESTGEPMSLIQWIAQRTNADVYGEIEASTSGETQGKNHYGKANVIVKFFESSTGRLLSSRSFSSQRTYSSSSQRDAVVNALQSSIYEIMPLLIADVESYIQKALGIKYELILHNTQDARLMREFIRGLEGKVKSLKRTAQSPEETRFEVYLLGTIEDLEEIIFSLADTIPGLQNLNLIYMRGNSLTFHTGL